MATDDKPPFSQRSIQRLWRTADAKLRQETMDFEIDQQASAGALRDALFRQVRPNGVGLDVGDGYNYGMGELTSVELTDIATLRELDYDQPLSKQGVGTGSILGLLIRRRNTSQSAPYMISTSDPMVFLDQIMSKDGQVISKYPAVWGVMLYTDEDAELASYVRRYFSSINVLSGTILRILVIEKPDDWENVRRYWGSHLSPVELELCRAMGWLNSTPYDRSRAYEIARRLGIRDEQLPCLALVDTPGLQDRIIFPILEATPQYFRGLFAAIKEAVGDVDVEQRTCEPRFYEGNFFDRDGELVRAAENYRMILEKVRAAVKVTAPGTYNFYGRTVFINHPSGSTSVSRDGIDVADRSGVRPENE